MVNNTYKSKHVLWSLLGVSCFLNQRLLSTFLVDYVCILDILEVFLTAFIYNI